jgi:hypothetical protein
MRSDDELREIQDMAVEHAIEEMQAADLLGIDSKDDRGDRGWLTGMAAKSLGVAVRIEQFLALRKDRKVPDDSEEEAKRALISRARAEVKGLISRAGKKATSTD